MQEWTSLRVGTFPGTGESAPRRQLADIAILDSDRYVVAWADADSQLRYAYFTTPSAPLGAESPGLKVSWMRANAGLATGGDCNGRIGVRAANVTVVETGTSMEAHVLATCAGEILPRKTIALGAGTRPSIVIADEPESPSLLVYGVQNVLYARLIDREAAPMDAPFPIATLPDGAHVFSTDVTWNKHSERFLVGYMEMKPGQFCRMQSLRLDRDGKREFDFSSAPGAPWSTCDFDAGGHHTSVAYHPDGDGSYLWWRQVPGGRGN